MSNNEAPIQNAMDEFHRKAIEFETSFVAECESTATVYDNIAAEFRVSDQGDAEWRGAMARLLVRKAAAFREAAETIRAVR